MTTITGLVTLPRVRAVVFWIATALLVFESVYGGGWDVFRIQYVRDVFDHLGYPHYLLTIIGIAKWLAAIALVVPGFPRLREWAYAGVFFVFAGAAASHLAAGDAAADIAAPLGFAGITLVSWWLRPYVLRNRFGRPAA